MNILGLNAFHGDASAALLSNGELTAAVEEERQSHQALGGVPRACRKVVSSRYRSG